MLTEPVYASTDDLIPEAPTSPIPDIPLDAVLLFPLLAVALVVFFPIFGKISTKTTSQSARNRLRRRRLLGRVSVITLPLAAAVSVAWPLWPLDPLGRSLQSLLICTVVLVPLFLWHGVLTWRQTHVSARKTAAAKERSGRGADRPISGAGADEETAEVAVGGSRASGIRASRVQANGVLAPAEAAASVHPDTSSGAYATPSGGGPSHGRGTYDGPAEAVIGGEGASVDEQLDRLVSLVDSYDLGEDDHRHAGSDHPLTGKNAATTSATAARSPSGAEAADATKTGAADRQPAAGDGARNGSGATVRTGLDPEALRATALELRGMKGIEVVRLVNGLRVDRKRLQRLVIAQRAAHESERQAHERTRTVARDAVRLAHTSRASQRLAEKAVRRERRDRTRAEEKYARVANALHSVMSIVEAERGERANGDAPDDFHPRESDVSDSPALNSS